MAKEIIKLKQHRGGIYTVVALENRIEPKIGDTLVARNVEELLIEANRIHSKLTLKIS
jgi:hypothetical protein